MISQMFDEIGRRIAAWFAPFLDALYLLEWWALLIVFIALCLLIGFFAQFKWVRAVLGILILIASAFVAGGTEMYRHIKTDGRKRK